MANDLSEQAKAKALLMRIDGYECEEAVPDEDARDIVKHVDAAVAERTAELEVKLAEDTDVMRAHLEMHDGVVAQRDALARRLAIAREALHHYGWDDPTDDGTIARQALAAIDAPTEK